MTKQFMNCILQVPGMFDRIAWGMFGFFGCRFKDVPLETVVKITSQVSSVVF